MQQRTRTWIVWGLLLSLIAVGACGGRRRPPVVTPPTPTCEGGTFTPAESSPTTALRTAHGTYLSAERGGGYPSCGVTADRAEASLWETFSVVRVDATHVGLRSSSGFLLSVDAAGQLAANRPYETPQAWETLTVVREGPGVALRTHLGTYLTAELDGTLRVTAITIGPWEIFTPSDPSALIGVVHPDPVQGAIWSDPNGCFGDDTGCRNFVIHHYGDLVDKMRLSPELALRDMDRSAEAGFHVYRMWAHIRPGGWPLSGHPVPSTGWDLEDEDTYRALVRVINEAALRGQRVTLETGGIDRRNTEQERSLMRRLNQAAHEAGAWKVAWFSPVNEPGSTHATSDDDGDNTPGHLKMLVDIARAGTQALWHIGGTDNEKWDDPSFRFSQKFYTHPDQTTGYYHGTRALNWWNKIQRPFTWYYEERREDGSILPGGYIRKWIDGEPFGLPCSGPPLQYVSVVQNCHEVDAETIALSVAIKTFRGMSALMSGNGVRRYQEWDRVIGWREVPWIVRQIPHDVATYTWAHHSGDTHDDKRTLVAIDDIRIDGVKHADGRFAYVIYGPKSGATANLRIDRSFTGALCNAVSMTCEDVSGDAGGTFSVTFTKGRLFVGQAK